MSSVVIAGDTSGTVTLAAPAVAGTTTLTLPTTNGNVVTDSATQTLTNKTLTSPTITGATITVASTAAPAFSASKTSSVNQSITSSTFTKVTYQVKDYDTASCFDNSTNYRFTPNVAGYYIIGAGFNSAAGGAPSRVILDLYKNGSQVKRLADISTRADNVSGSALLYFNGTTDYIEVYAYIAATSPSIYYPASDTFFTGVFVRSA